MPTCLDLSSGYAVVVAPAPADFSTCGAVALSGPEYAALAASPLDLSAADGATVAVAIIGVWSLGFVSRALIRTLGSDGPLGTSE